MKENDYVMSAVQESRYVVPIAVGANIVEEPATSSPPCNAGIRHAEACLFSVRQRRARELVR